MFIHWFPGHMTKALRQMEEDAGKVDCVIYVIDSRIPLASINCAYDKIFANKPRLYVLNKADMVQQNEIAKWKPYFSQNGNECIVTNSTVKGGSGAFISALKKLNAEKIEKYRNKGVKKTIRAMVIGVPNCGKSTLINSLIAKKRTVTGDRPGVTRGKQWVSIDPYIDLLDTPGTLYPDFSDQVKATHLAMVGSVKDDILDIVELACEIIKFLRNEYPENLQNKFENVSFSENDLDNLSLIAKKRGYVLKGGELDIERAAKAIILDFRRNAFGKIMIEKNEN